MPKPKGGKAKKEPYRIIFWRIPEPLKPQVIELKERYYNFLDQGGDPLAPPLLIDADKSTQSRFCDTDGVPHWRVGDRCACLMSSGTIIPEVEIVSIQSAHGSCKVAERHTDSHWSAKFEELIPLSVYALLKNLGKQCADLKQERDRLDQEMNALHEQTGDLHLQLEELKLINANLLDELDTLRSLSGQPVNGYTQSQKVNTPVANVPQAELQDNREHGKLVNEFTPKGSQPGKTSAIADYGLSERALAKRLGIDHTSVHRTRKRQRTDFDEYLSSRDPEGLTWRWDEGKKKYFVKP